MLYCTLKRRSAAVNGSQPFLTLLTPRRHHGHLESHPVLLWNRNEAFRFSYHPSSQSNFCFLTECDHRGSEQINVLV